MAPPKRDASIILFHPKKKKPSQVQGAGPGAGSRPQRPLPPNGERKSPSKPTPPRRQDDDLNSGPPPESNGEYTEFVLMSSALNGWKYDMMKFDSRKVIDLADWTPPVKLNRKDPPRRDAAPASVQQPVGPMMGQDGKPVIGTDGRIVMVDAEGKPIHNTSGAGPSGTAAGDKVKPGRKKFQKKTKQVYLIPEETRRLRKEERYPWVIEDATGKEVWVGQMEEVAKSQTHAFFMPTVGNTFKFVPAHRWYKFQKKSNHKVYNLEEVESMMAKMAKSKDPGRWLAKNVGTSKSNGTTDSAASTSTASMPYLQSGPSLVYDTGTSLGPGGRRLRVVDSGLERGLFGDDDDDDTKRRKTREYGGEGDQDEMDYEEVFQDDEEKPNVEDAEDEETKEQEERIKKEYNKAKVLNDGEEEEEEDDEWKLTKQGRQLRKLMRSLEKSLQYDSDDEENPYVSEDESSSEEEPETNDGPAVQNQSQSQSDSQQPPSSTSQEGLAPVKKEPSVPSLSRPTSPIQSGHSVVAKRATSPKIPKLKTSPNVSRANSPLAPGPASPGGRAASPVNGTNMNGSTPTSAKLNNKRKAEDTPTSPTSPTAGPSAGGEPLRKAKKRKADPNATPSYPITNLTPTMVARYLRENPGSTTKECIGRFRAYLGGNSPEVRKVFADTVKRVGEMLDNRLYLKPEFQDHDPPELEPTPTGAVPNGAAVSVA